MRRRGRRNEVMLPKKMELEAGEGNPMVIGNSEGLEVLEKSGELGASDV